MMFGLETLEGTCEYNYWHHNLHYISAIVSGLLFRGLLEFFWLGFVTSLGSLDFFFLLTVVLMFGLATLEGTSAMVWALPLDFMSPLVFWDLGPLSYCLMSDCSSALLLVWRAVKSIDRIVCEFSQYEVGGLSKPKMLLPKNNPQGFSRSFFFWLQLKFFYS